jgi:RNA:NAD 2'-phosphotransferase (TPT1/KptA family)
MAIHENLTKIPKQQLREVGWSKAEELVKVARKDGEKFDCATWLHRARELPKEGFKGEVERHRTANYGQGNGAVGDYLLQDL